MYVVTPFPNILHALDLTNPGATRWSYEPKPMSAAQGVACCDVVNRGAAYADGRVFFNTLDNHTVAVDAETGKEIWRTRLGDINLVRSLRSAAPAGENPWDAPTLEWATSSPPPYSFHLLPTVQSRSPLWRRSPDAAVVTGLRTDMREILVTTMLDAEPDNRMRLPDPSVWPLLAAIATGVTFITLIFTPWGLPIGAVLITLAFSGWGWPSRREHELQVREEGET
jgi:PQQ enzyme repeat